MAFLFAATLLVTGARTAMGQEEDNASVARFQLAESFLRAGQVERAIVILEQLYTDRPTTYVFFERLRQAYESSKRYDDAIRIVDEQIGREVQPVARVAERGRLRYLKGDEELAMNDFGEAIALAPDRSTSYLAVYQVLVQLRLFEEASSTLLSGREVLGDPTQFARELGYLFGLLGQHDRAMTEYVNLLLTDERQLGVVRSRLTRTGLSPLVLDQSIPVVERAVRSTPLNRSIRELLAWLYEEAEDFGRALDVNRAVDRLESEEGRVLFAFAARALNAGAFEAAQRSYEIILDRYPASVIAPEARRGIGQLHVQWAEALQKRVSPTDPGPADTDHYKSAMEAFVEFADAHPNHGLYPYVLLDMARIQQAAFFNLKDAHALYTDLVRRFPTHPATVEARFELGEIDLMRDRLDAARLTFQRLEDELRIGEQAERARFEIALIHFYRGEFESARTLLEAMEENTSTETANDAIELKVLLIESKGPDSLNTPLRRFAEAGLRLRQRRLDEAEALLKVLNEESGMHALNDDAHFLNAQIKVERGLYEDAAAVFGEIPLQYPSSYLADRSLFEAARVNEELLGNTERALELYSRLISEYPGSLLLSEARARYRELRGDGV